MTLGTILLIVLILILLGVIPAWPHSRSWGYAPTGLGGVLLVILIVLLLSVAALSFRGEAKLTALRIAARSDLAEPLVGNVARLGGNRKPLVQAPRTTRVFRIEYLGK